MPRPVVLFVRVVDRVNLFVGRFAMLQFLVLGAILLYSTISRAASGVPIVRLALEPWVVADPNDIEARGHTMSAASMGATAFQKGLGAIHSLSHPVGSLYDTHHGMTNAVFTPYVLLANRDAVEARIGRARCLLRPVADVQGLPPRDLGAPAEARRLACAARFQRTGGPARTDRRHGRCRPHRTGGNPVALTKELALAIFDSAHGRGL